MDTLKKIKRTPGSGVASASSKRRDLLAEALEEERLSRARALRPTVEHFYEPADLRAWVNTETQRPAYLKNGELVPYTPEEIVKFKDTELAFGARVHTFIGTLRPDTKIREGPGSLHYATGECFIGTFRHHRKFGQGMSFSPSGYAFEGTYVDDKPHGLGLETYPGGDAYLGEFAHGLPHGHGVMYYSRNGSRYEGYFDCGEKHGQGIVFYENGDVFQGTWKAGQRHGYGITTYASTGRSYSSVWRNDECPFKSTFVKDVAVPQSAAVPLEHVVSPLGINLRSMKPLPDIVDDLPAFFYRRLKSAFESLDVDVTGEIDLEFLRSWWTQQADTADGAEVSRSPVSASPGGGRPQMEILDLLQRASANGVTLLFSEMIGVMVPGLSDGTLRRVLTTEITPETVFRLRGQLAGVASKQTDTFFALRDAKQGDTEPPVITLASVRVSRASVGGVPIPYSLFVRAAAVDGTPHGSLTFTQLVQQLYPQLPPGTAQRLEVENVPVKLLHVYAKDFDERLDHLQLHYVGIERLKTAQRKWQHRCAVERHAARNGDDIIASPYSGSVDSLLADGVAREGPFHNIPVWDVGDIPVTLSLARLVDRNRTGWVSLLDLLRFVYPNVPCIATKERLGQTVRADELCRCVLCVFCGERYSRPRPPSPYADGSAAW